MDAAPARVHADSEAPIPIRNLKARAFTTDNDIYFAPGQFRPNTADGVGLIAHELTHVAQQRASPGMAQVDEKTASAAERQAEYVEAEAASGRVAVPSPLIAVGTRTVQRAPITARESEAEAAIDAMFGVLQFIEEVGAEVRFTFWTSGGAITVDHYDRIAAGSGKGKTVSKEQFARGFRSFTTFVGTAERLFSVDLVRTDSSWEIGRLGTTPGTAPPEGRAIPVASKGRVETFLDASRVTKEMGPHMHVQRGGEARFLVSVHFVDDRIPSWRYISFTAGGMPYGAPYLSRDIDSEGQVLQILMALSHGVGTRDVQLDLRGVAPAGATQSHWTLTEAGEPRAPSPPSEPDAVTEYRQMHEQFFVKARAELKEAGVMVAGWTLEQLAIWIIGGAIFRLLGLGVEAVAPTLVKLLRPGGRAALRTLAELIADLAPEEQAELRALAAKAESQGLEALTAAENTTLKSLLAKLEKLFVASSAERAALIGEIRAAGAKFTEKEIVWIVRSQTGRVVWLEEGTAKSGLAHILQREAETNRFAGAGIAKDDIGPMIREAVKSQTPLKIGTEGEHYYVVEAGGVKRMLRVIIGDNGYVVSATPLERL